MEQCDDGNTADGDCCSSTCQYESTSQTCSTPTCNGQCDGLGMCKTAPFCCLTDAQCDDGLDCTIDTCDEVCQNVPAPAGTSCDDQQDCTINDACNGVDSVCVGENSCPGGCGLNGICCHSVCECKFGWDTDPSCSIGPDPLNLGFALEHVVDASRDGWAYSLVVPGGIDIVVSVRARGGAGTRAASGVYLYGSFSEIPDRPNGLVLHEYRSETPENAEQSFVVNSTRSGLLFVSVFRAQGVASSEYELYAGDIKTGRTAPSSPISLENAQSKPWLLIAVGTVLTACCLLTVAAVVVRKRRAASKAGMMFGVYEGDGDVTIDLAPLEDPIGLPPTAPFVAVAPTSPAAPAAPSSIETYQAVYAFAGREADELSFQAGDMLEVIEEFDDGWCRGQVKGSNVQGIFPLNYAKPAGGALPPPPPPKPGYEA